MNVKLEQLDIIEQFYPIRKLKGSPSHVSQRGEVLSPPALLLWLGLFI